MTIRDSYQKLEKIFYKVCHRLEPKRVRCFSLCKKLLLNGIGLEIGGPSQIFTSDGILPLYTVLKRVDNSNYSANTIWDAASVDVNVCRDKETSVGTQYVNDATDLKPIPSATYDCVLASHVIEHIANPLKALREWAHVLKEMGILVLVVPHKDGTFDHRRPITSFDHLLSDFESGTTEEDLGHLPEILELHDLERDSAAGTFESFKKRSGKNIENRALHHHVFDTKLAVAMVDYMKFRILAVKPILPIHIVIIAQKLPMRESASNQIIIEKAVKQNRYSPFASDRRPES